MDAAHIETFLQKLRCDKIRVVSSVVKACCPLARWTHPKGREDHPSFFVMIDESGTSGYRCHSCGASGSLLELVWALMRKPGVSLDRKMDLQELVEFVQLHNQPSPEYLASKLEMAKSSFWGAAPVEVAGIRVSPRLATSLSPEAELPTLDEEILKHFSLPGHIVQYLRDRGVSEASMATWELGWHDDRRRISIPIRDRMQRLVGISGRAYDHDDLPKYMHGNGFRRDYYLYGEHRVEKGKPGILVEGFFDVIGLAQAGYPNAVAMMGSYLSRFQIEKMVQLFTAITILPDGDLPGREAAAKAEQTLRERFESVRIADIPDGKDPDELTSDELLEALGAPTPN